MLNNCFIVELLYLFIMCASLYLLVFLLSEWKCKTNVRNHFISSKYLKYFKAFSIEMESNMSAGQCELYKGLLSTASLM